MLVGGAGVAVGPAVNVGEAVGGGMLGVAVHELCAICAAVSTAIAVRVALNSGVLLP